MFDFNNEAVKVFSIWRATGVGFRVKKLRNQKGNKARR